MIIIITITIIIMIIITILCAINEFKNMGLDR